MDEPLFIEPFIGYRAFVPYVTEESTQVVSVCNQMIWTKPDMGPARCMRGVMYPSPHSRPSNHLAPALDCSCGYYAVRNITHLAPALGWATAPGCNSMTENFIFAEVEVSGRVIRAKNGYRSENQRIRKFMIDEHSNRRSLQESLETIYRVPVVVEHIDLLGQAA